MIWLILFLFGVLLVAAAVFMVSDIIDTWRKETRR
jgi:hypothetical protein